MARGAAELGSWHEREPELVAESRAEALLQGRTRFPPLIIMYA